MQWLFLAAVATAPTPEPIDLAWHFRGRPPIVEVSRESAEPPLIAPTCKESLQVQKTCFCNHNCVCGCNSGQPCRCSVTVNYPGIPDSSARGAEPVQWGGELARPASAPVFRSMLPSVPMFFGRASNTAGAPCKT